MEESNKRRKSRVKKPTLTQNQTDVINELQKRYFDDDNNFIDYFIEVGVKPEIFKNKTLYLSDDPQEINQNLIPEIITKFPSFDKKTVVIENTMIHQMFPQGFNMVESTKKPNPNFYCLVLDNQLYSAIYTRKYLACLVIYESINEYKKLYDKYIIQDEKFLSIVKKDSKSDPTINKETNKYVNYYIPKCLCLVSVHPYIDKFEEILRTIYELATNEMYSYIFIDQIIEKLIIETPKIPRGLKKIVLRFPYKEIELTETKMNEFPSVNVNLAYTFEILNYNNIIEIYKYLLYETKLIFFSENLYKLTNTILSFLFLLTPFNYQFQIVSILSKELYNFIETISPFIFGINEKYKENFFTKHKISIEDTTICIIDIDKDNYFLIAPGGVLNQKEYPEFPKRLRKKLEDKIKSFLINKKKKKSVGILSGIPMYLTMLEEDIHKSSTCKNNFLINKITHKPTKDHNSSDNEFQQKKNYNSHENKEIQKIFSKFMISLLKDYPKFLTKDYSVNKNISQSIKDLIDLKSYLNLYSNGERSFYNKIFSTQMFIEFIYKRMMPKDCNEKVEVLFIEEKINEKINEKNLFSKIGKQKNSGQYILLNCKDYDYDKEIEVIDLTCQNGLSNGLKCYLLNNKFLLNNFLNKGYMISIDDDTKDITFTYNVFPSLLSDKLFILNIDEYRKNLLFYKQIEEINTKIVNRSALKFIRESTRLVNSESQNDLYLCYLILWSMAFWYMEEDEKEGRFFQMLQILQKVEEHDLKIFEVLFKTLVDYNRNENVILLYKKFIHLRLNPTWEMFSLVSKIIKKKKNIDKKTSLLRQETYLKKSTLLPNKDRNVIDYDLFSNRTFKIQNKDDFIFSNKVLIHAYFICRKCNGIMNLGEICTGFRSLKMERDTYGFARLKCTNKNKEGKICNNLCEQNFKIRLGEELFNQKLAINQLYRYLTSMPCSIILLSPTEIKNVLFQIATNKKKEEKFDILNFKLNYPEIFWSLVWYFDLNNIDKSFMLPYERTLKKNNIETSKNSVEYFYNKSDKDENTNQNDNKNKKIYKINAKNKKNKINIFKNKKKIEKYKTEDLCIQNVFEFGIIENSGLFTYKNLFICEKNISYNEIPLLPFDKDNNSTYAGSSLYFNDTESSTGTSQIRDSLLSYQNKKRNTFASTSNYIVSKLSKSGPGLSGIGLKLGARDSDLTKCIVFEESDDSLEDS